MIPQLRVNRRLRIRMRRPLFRPNERRHHVLRKRSRCDLPGVDAGSNFRTRPPGRPPESRRRNSPPRPPTNAALRAQVLRACPCHTSDRHCPHRRTIPSALRRRSACPPLLAPTVWGRNHPSTTGLHRNAGSSICAISRCTGITRKSLSDPAQEVVMSPRAVRKLRIQCLPDVSRKHVWRTGTSVHDIGGDHNLKVLVLPVRGQPPSELIQVVGVGDKLA
jgi:hypothetical protein